MSRGLLRWVLALGILLGMQVRADDPSRGQVLVLHSYHRGYSWTDDVHAGILQGLRDSPRPLDVLTEYMDWKHAPTEANLRLLRELYRHKYGGRRFDVVVTTDNAALDFAMKERDALFPGAALAFCGVNDYGDALTAGVPRITGVAETVDALGTLRAALRFHPDTRHVEVIVDGTETGRAIRREIEAAFVHFPQVSHAFTGDLPVEEVLQRAERIPAGGIVLVAVYVRDPAGRYFDLWELPELLRGRTRVPIYGLWEPELGHGIVGGSLTSGHVQGTLVAQQALRLLGGEAPERIPVVLQPMARMAFDDRELRRLGIPRSALPPGSEVLFGPKPFVERFQREILATLGILALAVVGLVAALVVRRRMEAAVRRLNAELEERVQDRTRRLETANRELNEFAYIVSHDLKAPLRAVGQLAHWIREDHGEALGPEGQEQLELLLARVKRMDGLINGILHYSRLGGPSERRDPVESGLMVDEVIQALAPPPGIQVSRAGDFPVLRGDRVQFQQVFQNLIGNAIKYMDKPEGRIEVACAPEEGGWHFSVADNGPGIEAKYFGKIFQIFQTLAPRDEVESTGIGLTLVKKIIEGYGGRIWPESTPGLGTTFHFVLPERVDP